MREYIRANRPSELILRHHEPGRQGARHDPWPGASTGLEGSGVPQVRVGHAGDHGAEDDPVHDAAGREG